LPIHKKQSEVLEKLQKVIELAPDSQEARYARMTIQQLTEGAEEGELKE